MLDVLHRTTLWLGWYKDLIAAVCQNKRDIAESVVEDEGEVQIFDLLRSLRIQWL